MANAFLRLHGHDFGIKLDLNLLEAMWVNVNITFFFKVF